MGKTFIFGYPIFEAHVVYTAMSNIIQPSLMTIDEIKHFDNNGKCIWEEHDIPNIWHTNGQQFILSVAFDTDGSFSVPTDYFVGLDNRTALDADDTLSDLAGEPSTNGYVRQPLSSTDGFSVQLTGGAIKAVSGIANFVATAGEWGPVRNLFLSTSLTNSGVLISSAALSGPRSVTAGGSLSVRVSLSLAACP